MPFKIVQTKEKEVTELSIVPSDWESKGKLFWPQKHVKNRSRLIKDDRSKPSPEWDIVSCVVKRSKILTYKEAVDEIKIMEGHTDTDNDLNDNHQQQPVHTMGQRSEEINFEALADMLQSKTHLPIVNEAPSTSKTSENILEQPTIESTEIFQLCNNEHNTQIIANQALILEKINNLYVVLDAVMENPKKIAQNLAVLSVQMDDGNSKILQKMEQPLNVTLLKDANSAENESFKLSEIDNLKQLEDFELLLLDQAQITKIKKLLSILCSESQGNGISCAYKLLDTLITRDFMCKCSWSGGSRGVSSKIALKDHKLFIKFFFEMIFSWDTSFTIEKLEHFFKVVLKNAVKRKAMKNLRTSSKRIRKTRKTATNTNATELLQDNQANESINENHDQLIDEINENNPGNAENAENIEIGSVNEPENAENRSESELDLC